MEEEDFHDGCRCWMLLSQYYNLTFILWMCLFFLQMSCDTDVSMAVVSERSSIPNVSAVQLSGLFIYSLGCKHAGNTWSYEANSDQLWSVVSLSKKQDKAKQTRSFIKVIWDFTGVKTVHTVVSDFSLLKDISGLLQPDLFYRCHCVSNTLIHN